MANEKNLIPNKNRTPSELREMTSKGGKKSGEVRRQRKAMAEQMKMLLSLPITNNKSANKLKKLGIDTENMDNQMLIIVGLYNKAINGDVQAFNTIQKLVEHEHEQDKETLEKLDEILKELGGVV